MRILLFAGFALGCLLGIGAVPASAGTINGMQQVAVCDPTTNQGLNCAKPAADGSIPVTFPAGGGSAITGPLGSQTIPNSVATTSSDGAIVSVGTTSDSACTTDTATCDLIQLIKRLNQNLTTLNTTAGSSLAAGAAIVGKFGIDQTTPGTTNAVQTVPGTSGGLTTFYLTAANSTNATNIKASAGQLYRADLSNNSATPAYVSYYNTSGTPTCGTSIVYQMMIPANSTSGAGWVSAGSMGLAFSSGIGICVATGIAGTGSVAASAYTISLGYK